MTPWLESLPSRGWLKWSSLITTGSEVSCLTTGSWSRFWKNMPVTKWRSSLLSCDSYVNERSLTSPLEPGDSRIQKSSVSWARSGMGVMRGEWRMGKVGLESWVTFPLSSGNRNRSEWGGLWSWFRSSCAPIEVIELRKVIPLMVLQLSSLLSKVFTVLVRSCCILPVSLLHRFTHQILQHLLLIFSKRQGLRCGTARTLLPLSNNTLNQGMYCMTVLQVGTTGSWWCLCWP